MRISARCDYACRALLELAMRWPAKEPVQLQVISENQNIPRKYLVQIFLQLKRLGLVESIRGKYGGYRLAKAPSEIALGDVMREIGGDLLPLAKTAGATESVFAAIWQEVESAMAKILDRISFEDIADKVRGQAETFIYQI